jgi:hypothetical protein
MQVIMHQPNDGAVIAPKPPLFIALSSGFIVPFNIGQSLRIQASAEVVRGREGTTKKNNPASRCLA